MDSLFCRPCFSPTTLSTPLPPLYKVVGASRPVDALQPHDRDPLRRRGERGGAAALRAARGGEAYVIGQGMKEREGALLNCASFFYMLPQEIGKCFA